MIQENFDNEKEEDIMERIESIQAGRNTSVFRGTFGGSDYQKQRAISYFDPSGDFVVTKPIDPPIRKGT